jgi:GTP-binding protein Era
MKSGFVSLTGRPNAGKSTLLNRVVGAKLAIVSDKPQTTRTRILGVRNYADAQVILLDTPGIHRPLHRMNVRMVDTAVATMGDVDVVGVVVDVHERAGRGHAYLMDLVKGAGVPVVLILNKIDLIKKTRLLPLIDEYAKTAQFAEIVPISAKTGDNVDRLERVMIERLPEGRPVYPRDYVTDQPERFLAAEIVREQVLQHTRAEIPFSSAVLVDRFEEPSESAGAGGKSGSPLRLYCTIVVERESQKPILIGKGGGMIRRIGTDARQELEQFFQTRVFLDLHVRVREDWREDERVLGQIGVGPRIE